MKKIYIYMSRIYVKYMKEIYIRQEYTSNKSRKYIHVKHIKKIYICVKNIRQNNI